MRKQGSINLFADYNRGTIMKRRGTENDGDGDLELS